MPDQAPHADSNAANPASDAQWTRLVAEWFEEQAALVVAELERAGGASAEAPEAARADRGR
jgi:hypothetical protein